MTRTRTTPETLEAQAIDAATAALQAADIDVDATTGGGIEAKVDGRSLDIVVIPVSYCTGERARELVRRQPARARRVNLVVADRVTAEAKAVLGNAGWSWLDRRGELHLRGPGVRVDLALAGLDAQASARRVEDAIAGRSGLTVSYWLCAHPGQTLSPTRSAPLLRLAPSTISTSVRRLAGAGLVHDNGTGVFPELFWELADAWRVERTWLIASPDPANGTNPDPHAPRWRRTGTAAAAAYGAPVVSTAGGPIELYVVGPVDVSIAVRRYGRAEPGTGAAAIAVAPVSDVVAGPDGAHLPVLDGWPAAPMLAVALDLAQDRTRGRDILGDWSIDDAVWK